MKEIVALVFGLGLLLNAALFVPQALTLWRKKDSADISLLTFSGFTVMQFVGTLHGWFQGDRYLMFGMLASLLACGTVTLLAVLYRRRPAATA